MAEMKVHVADIAKYAKTTDEAAVQGIVRHCGIALHSRDGSLVSASDPAELATVRDSFLKKKLALTQDDAALDAAIHSVMTTLKADHSKSRVTVYYLLAEHFDKLASFHKA